MRALKRFLGLILLLAAYALICLTFFFAGLQASKAGGCTEYKDLAAGLKKRAREKMVFRGWGDTRLSKRAPAIYELYLNESTGSWSFLIDRVSRVEDGDIVRREVCAMLILSGMGYEWIDAKEGPDKATRPETGHCPGHDHIASAMSAKYNEYPQLLLQISDGYHAELFTGERSWTLARSAGVGAIQSPAGERRLACWSVMAAGITWDRPDNERSF